MRSPLQRTRPELVRQVALRSAAYAAIASGLFILWQGVSSSLWYGALGFALIYLGIYAARWAERTNVQREA